MITKELQEKLLLEFSVVRKNIINALNNIGEIKGGLETYCQIENGSVPEYISITITKIENGIVYYDDNTHVELESLSFDELYDILVKLEDVNLY